MEIKYKRRRYIGAISLLSRRPHSGRISRFSYFSLSSLSLQLHFPFVEFIDVIVLLLERFFESSMPNFKTLPIVFVYHPAVSSHLCAVFACVQTRHEVFALMPSAGLLCLSPANQHLMIFTC